MQDLYVSDPFLSYLASSLTRHRIRSFASLSGLEVCCKHQNGGRLRSVLVDFFMVNVVLVESFSRFLSRMLEQNVIFVAFPAVLRVVSVDDS